MSILSCVYANSQTFLWTYFRDFSVFITTEENETSKD